MQYLIAGLCIPFLASCSVLPSDGNMPSTQGGYKQGNSYQSSNVYQDKMHGPLITQTGTLTPEQQNILQDAYSEELLAHDIYTYMVTKYPSLSEVKNIIGSEDQHRDSIGRLIDAYGLTRPTDYRNYADTYTTLKNMIDSSLTGAIEVGIMVETGDIDHLLAEYKKVENPDIRRVFENIGGGSFNHLRAFLREAQNVGYTPQTDTSKYLTADDLNTRGPLNNKMTELLEANNLPTYSSSGNTQERGGMGKNGGQGNGGGRGMGQGHGMGSGHNNQ